MRLSDYNHLLGGHDDWDPTVKLAFTQFDRIATALERIADRLDELERDRRITGAKKGERPTP
jgi:hypothetical protein